MAQSNSCARFISDRDRSCIRFRPVRACPAAALHHSGVQPLPPHTPQTPVHPRSRCPSFRPAKGQRLLQPAQYHPGAGVHNATGSLAGYGHQQQPSWQPREAAALGGWGAAATDEMPPPQPAGGGGWSVAGPAGGGWVPAPAVAAQPTPGPMPSLGLPQGWEVKCAPDGRTYYIDHNTGSTHVRRHPPLPFYVPTCMDRGAAALRGSWCLVLTFPPLSASSSSLSATLSAVGAAIRILKAPGTNRHCRVESSARRIPLKG